MASMAPLASRWIAASVATSGSKCLSDVASSHPGVARVVLKKGKSHLVVNGNPMVYSGAVDRVIGKPAPKTGDAVLVTNGTEVPLAWGVYNEISMFRVRVLQTEEDAERDPQSALNVERLIESRLAAAVQLREALRLPSAHTNAYRLVNSEGDRLSGLTVDVFGEHVVVASSAAWVERSKSIIEGSLRRLLGKDSLSWRSSVELLKQEGLEGLESQVQPDEPNVQEVQVIENDILYQVALGGQKTGFYVDQRDNRLLLRSFCKERTVLDLCCYSGGFALNAAVGGASHVIGIDSSKPAIDLANASLQLNNLDKDKVIFEKADIVQFMRFAISEGKTWDVVVLDPPKLAPSRKVLTKASIKYRSLNAMAMQITKPGGLLMTCCCSGAVTQSQSLLRILQDAAKIAKRRFSLLRAGGPSADHPVDPGYPEGSYLTNYLLQIV